MSDELDQLRERIRQNRLGRQRALDEARTKPRADAARRAGTFTAGDQVFDRVSGEVGEVLGGTRENIIVPTPKQ